jgi:uncharacterized protein
MTQIMRIAIFLLAVVGVWTFMHALVLHRLWDLPAAPGRGYHVGLIVAFALLWVAFPLGMALHRPLGAVAAPLYMIGTAWLGILFLLFVWLIAADLISGFGYLMNGRAARAVGVAVAALLAVVGFVQAMRPPVVVEHSVGVAGLSNDHDGLVMVQISDLHLGPGLGAGWLSRRVSQIEALEPDLLFVTGDLVDQDADRSRSIIEVLARLKPRLGVFGVAGNHEFYVGLPGSLKVYESAGFKVLRDDWVEVAPGLIVAGVDDLTARRQMRAASNGASNGALDSALAGRPPGTTIFLSHTPWEAERAAELGAHLMLSGHTHGGQIWPFGYAVGVMYPYVAGRYEVNGMTLVVSRGTGYWGPPMRLFHRAEIHRFVLVAAADS